MAQKKKKGKKKASGSVRRRVIAFIVFVLLIAGGYILLKPIQEKYYSENRAEKLYFKTDEVLDRFGSSLIVIDSREEKSLLSFRPVRKKIIRAYSREEARKVADALKGVSLEEKLLFSEKPYSNGEEEDGFKIEIGNTGYSLEEIILTFDKVRKSDKKINGKLAIIIDDIGENVKRAEEFATLDFPETLAILPGLKDSSKCAEIARKNNKQIILHCPMEPLDSKQNPGSGVLTVSMSDDEIITALRKDLDSIDGEIGVNNHMGSRFTTNLRGLRIVMQELKERNLFFIDSRTDAKSLGYETAEKADVKAGYSSLFLDTRREIPVISKKISDAADIASKKGSTIVIGHPEIETLAALKIKIPELRKKGLEMVFASELVN